ncbi:hypothetical protein EV183_003904 [Coemansia sp. RSA 2336]|nr:hypothetical protein EV183_003904 [Coemansia sp. RSA 2336]
MERPDTANTSQTAEPATNTATVGSADTKSSRVSNPTKEAWILDSLKKRREEFLSKQQIQAVVGTWNVNGKPPPQESLRSWLGFVPDGAVELEKLPELVVLGFQELDVRAEAFVYNNSIKDMEWTEAVESSMGPARSSLIKMATKQLIGMFIMVYVRADMVAHVDNIQTSSVGCGIMGVMGNKGAVAVRMTIRDTPVCFVCSHLAHEATQVDRRNAQFHDLCKRLTFSGSNTAYPDPLTPSGKIIGSGSADGERAHTVFDHSYIVWLGDLNYRLAIDTGDMSEILARGEHRSLLGLDQLQIVRMNKQAFDGFEEGEVKFAPTYKYVVGTSEYDSKRRPAWCDRVLWWTRPGCEGGISCQEYTAISEICTSDHKPVRSQLLMDVWQADVERRHSVYLEVLRELDRYENECIPTARLNETTVDFGQVFFGRVVRRRLQLDNVGQVPLEFSFVPTPNRQSVTPAWLNVSPSSGMLLPGQRADLEFAVMVDERTSELLNTRVEEMDDILVLHLKRGRDYFIQVQGAYQVSVFGMSLDVLVHCKSAVRSMTRADFERCLESGQFSVPKCMWTLIDFLSQYGLDRGLSLFEYAGDRMLGRRIREWLDLDEPLDPAAILQWPEEAPVPADISRMSLTDQTLVPSMVSDFDMQHAPSTAEALERLSLSPWAARTPRPDDAAQRQDSDSDVDEQIYRPASLSADMWAGNPLPESIAARSALPHDAGVDTVASCLIELLRSLPEPLIPEPLFAACIEAGGISRAAALEALEVLAPGNLNVLVYLLAFLREVVERGAASAARIACVFSRALLRPPADYTLTDNESTNAQSFIMFLLRSHGQI